MSQTPPLELTGSHGRAEGIARVIEIAIFVALLTLLALTAIPYGTVEPWWKAVFECGVFVLASAWVVQGIFGGTWFVSQHKMLLPLLGLAGLALLQTVLPWRSVGDATGSVAGWRPISFAPADTRLVAYQLIALVTVGGLLLRFTNTRRRLWVLVCTVIGVGLASTIFGFARMALQQKVGFLLPYLQPNDGSVPGGVGFAQFINRNHFAFLAEMSLGLVLGLMVRRPMSLVRWAVGLSIAIPMWIAVVLSGSRGGLVSILGQVVFIAVIVFIAGPGHQLLMTENDSPKVRRLGPFLVTRVILIGSFLVVMMIGIIWVGGDPLALRLEAVPNEFGVTQSDQVTPLYRSSIWPMTWQMIKDHSVAGIGFGGYWIAITKYHHGSGEVTPQEAHNDYLELLASGGLIGAALVIWFATLAGMSVYRCWQSRDAFRRAACLGALTSLLGVALHSVVDFGLHITINALVFLILVVIATLTPAPAPGGNERVSAS